MQFVIKYAIAFLTVVCINFCSANTASAAWQETLKQARHQTVYFYTWGGSKAVNDYITWASAYVQKEYQITLTHIKIDDTVTIIQRLIAEKRAKNSQASSADLLWVNGENFKRLKQQALLYGPFTQHLPNMAYIDTRLPVTQDFGENIDGLEAPWGISQFSLIFDAKYEKQPPKNAQDLLQYVQQPSNSGRVSYPKLPDFHGVSFLKQLLLELTPDPNVLYQPATLEIFTQATIPLWDYLDKLHPYLWQRGKSFVNTAAQTRQMLGDRTLNLAMSFNPLGVQNDIKNGKLPQSARQYAMDIGALTNIHFLAIPKYSASKEAAEVVINFLLSARAQAKKSDPNVWGDLSVLDRRKLPAEQAKFFSGPSILFKAVPEPDVTWHEALEKAWLQRYVN